MPRVAIQVLLYKGARFLPMLLESVRAQTLTDWELFFCENSCNNEEITKAKAVLEQSGVPYQLHVSQTNLGFAGGHNQLFPMHQSEYVFLLNQDSYLEPTYVQACVERFATSPKCASVTGLVYRWTVDPSQKQPLTDDTLIDTAGLEYRCLANVVDRCAGMTKYEAGERIMHAEKMFGVSGAIAMFRRSAVMEVSPEGLMFEPDFFMYKEDIDLAIRLKRKGYEAWFDPAAVAFHERGVKEETKGILGRIRAERKRPAHLREIMYRNQYRLYFYHTSFAIGGSDILRTSIFEVGRGVLVFLASPRVFVRAWKQILCQFSFALRRRKALRDLGLPFVPLDV